MTGAAIVSFYLWTYASHQYPIPLGWDSPGYAWRTHLVSAEGVRALPSRIQPPGPVNPGRPGFVVIAAILSGLMRVDALRLVMVMPGVAAAAIGLAAGLFVRRVPRRPRWEAGAIAVGVGTSAFVVHLINLEGYQDAAIATAVIMAAAALIARAVDERRAVVPAAVLVGAAGVIHWNFFLVGLAAIGLTALISVLYPPHSPGQRRAGPLVRLGAVIGGSLALALLFLVVVMGAGVPHPLLSSPQFAAKLRRDLPRYWLPATLIAATAGAIWLADRSSRRTGPDDERHRYGIALIFLLAWGEVALLAFLDQRVLHRPVPTHRILAFTLALPILAGLGVVGAARVAGNRTVRRWPSWSASVTGAMIVGVIGLSAWGSIRTWDSFRPVMSGQQMVQARSAGRYLDAFGLPDSTPLVFVVDDRTPSVGSSVWLAAHSIRAGLPAGRITSAYLFIGQPEDYLAGRPGHLDVDPNDPLSTQLAARYLALSQVYLHAVAPTYGHGAVAVILSSANLAYDGWVDRHPDRRVVPGVAMVTPPLRLGTGVAGAAGRPSTLRPLPVWRLAGLGFAVLAAVALVGLGWARFLADPGMDWVEIGAWSPAIGFAALVLGGILLDRVGLRLRGAGAVSAFAVIGVLGWGLALVRQRWAASSRSELPGRAGRT